MSGGPPWTPELAEELRKQAEERNGALVARIRALRAKLDGWEQALFADVMGDPIGRYVTAMESALAGVDSTPLDQLMIADLVQSYAEMVRGGGYWTAERSADAILDDVVTLPSTAARPFEFRFGKKLAANRDKLVAAIEAKANTRRGRRGKYDVDHGADAALLDLLKSLGMAVKDTSALRVARARVRKARNGVTF